MSRTQIDPDAFADSHRTALFRLVDHILAHASAVYSNEFEAQIRQVFDSFDQYVRGLIAYAPHPAEDGLDSVGRSHNYVTAQCSALLLFAHDISRIADRDGLVQVGTRTEKLWKELSDRYQVFFDRLPPYARW